LVMLSMEYYKEISEFSFFRLERKQQLHISYLVAGFSLVLIGLFAAFTTSRKISD